MPSPSPAELLDKRWPVPTHRLVGAALGLTALAAITPLVGALGVLLGLTGVLLLLVAVDVLTRPARDALRVEREVRAAYSVGRRGTYTLKLTNTGPRALAVEVHEVFTHALEGNDLAEKLLLAPGESVARVLPFVGLRRGEHRLLPVGVRVAHPVGLIAYQHHRDLDQSVLITPGRPAGETEWLLSQAAVIEEIGHKRIRRRGAEREFESLREYVVGDQIRRIDWKASARRQKPMVRLYESERNAEVMLAIDCGRLMGTLVDGVPKLDLALTPILDLAAVALRRGERVGLLGFDSSPRAFLPPRSGLAQLNAIQRATAALPDAREPTSYLRAVRHLEAHHRKRCLLVVFTDFTDELSARDMYASLAALTRRHVLIFVGVGDPQLEVIFRDDATDPRSIFQSAVAGQLLGERRRVLAQMQRLGIFTVDAEPSKLSGPLIHTFLDVRLRGAL